jgi:hypothetical protein
VEHLQRVAAFADRIIGGCCAVLMVAFFPAGTTWLPSQV